MSSPSALSAKTISPHAGISTLPLPKASAWLFPLLLPYEELASLGSRRCKCTELWQVFAETVKTANWGGSVLWWGWVADLISRNESCWGSILHQPGSSASRGGWRLRRRRVAACKWDGMRLPAAWRSFSLAWIVRLLHLHLTQENQGWKTVQHCSFLCL